MFKELEGQHVWSIAGAFWYLQRECIELYKQKMIGTGLHCFKRPLSTPWEWLGREHGQNRGELGSYYRYLREEWSSFRQSSKWNRTMADLGIFWRLNWLDKRIEVAVVQAWNTSTCLGRLANGEATDWPGNRRDIRGIEKKVKHSVLHEVLVTCAYSMVQ